MSWFPNTEDIDTSQKPPPLPPNRPNVMALEPDEDKVDTIMSMGLGFDRATAVRYLKAKNNSVEAALNAFFEGEDISAAQSASTWDEAAWTADRDGLGANDPSQRLQPATASAAATRPNSPASSLTARQNLNPLSQNEADEDLARAIELSQGDLRSVGEQETGLVQSGWTEPKFVPATKHHYDEKSWGIVPFSMDQTSEVVPDADIETRIHVPGEPRVLKYLTNGDYLANFLTICYAIDGAKEAFLARSHVADSYGQDPDWWKGVSISMPRIVHIGNDAQSTIDGTADEELRMEVQRLMALLAESTRSYASIGALVSTEVMSRSDGRSAPLETFLLRWINMTEQSAREYEGKSASDIFTTSIGTSSSDGVEVPNPCLIDIALKRRASECVTRSLTEVLDELLWDTNVGGDEAADNYIIKPAEVLVLRLSLEDSAEQRLNVEIPATLYLDRYLRDNISQTRTIRSAIVTYRKRIDRINSVIDRLTVWRVAHQSKQAVATKSLLDYAEGLFSGRLRTSLVKADVSNNALTNLANQEAPPQHALLADKLSDLSRGIDDKVRLLQQELTTVRQALAGLSQQAPSGTSPEQLRYRYYLRGVATKPNVTYVLCPIDTEQDEDKAEDDNTPEGMQWWRIEYEVNPTGSGARVTKTKTADYDVLRAVELEHKTALLVYASDWANTMHSEGVELPRPLAEFVQTDNQLFAHELASKRHQPPAYGIHDASGTTLHSRGSMESLTVQRSEDGDSPRHIEEVVHARLD